MTGSLAVDARPVDPERPRYAEARWIGLARSPPRPLPRAEGGSRQPAGRSERPTKAMAAIRLTVVMLERGVGPSSQPPAFEGRLFGLTEGRTGNSKFGVCGRLPQGAVEHGCPPPFARAGPSEAQPIFACFALFSDKKQCRTTQPTPSLRLKKPVLFNVMRHYSGLRSEINFERITGEVSCPDQGRNRAEARRSKTAAEWSCNLGVQRDRPRETLKPPRP